MAAEPLRRCRVCRRQQPKRNLIRWVKAGGQLIRDDAQRLPGRGYYTDTVDCAAKLPAAIKLKR